MNAAARLWCASLFALAAGGCSGSSQASAPAPAPVPTPSPSPAHVASLSIGLSGTPSFATAQSAATYPIDLKAFRSDGTLITGAYAQAVTVVLIPPQCEAGFGLEGGSTPTSPIDVPISTGVCSPGTNANYSATAVTSGSTAIALTWNGTPTTAPGSIEAYATGVPEVTSTFP